GSSAVSWRSVGRGCLFDIAAPPCRGSPSLKTTSHYRESGVRLRVIAKSKSKLDTSGEPPNAGQRKSAIFIELTSARVPKRHRGRPWRQRPALLCGARAEAPAATPRSFPDDIS